jgi:hypothetical protein
VRRTRVPHARSLHDAFSPRASVGRVAAPAGMAWKLGPTEPRGGGGRPRRARSGAVRCRLAGRLCSGGGRWPVGGRRTRHDESVRAPMSCCRRDGTCVHGTKSNKTVCTSHGLIRKKKPQNNPTRFRSSTCPSLRFCPTTYHTTPRCYLIITTPSLYTNCTRSITPTTGSNKKKKKKTAR